MAFLLSVGIEFDTMVFTTFRHIVQQSLWLLTNVLEATLKLFRLLWQMLQ